MLKEIPHREKTKAARRTLKAKVDIVDVSNRMRNTVRNTPELQEALRYWKIHEEVPQKHSTELLNALVRECGALAFSRIADQLQKFRFKGIDLLTLLSDETTLPVQIEEGNATWTHVREFMIREVRKAIIEKGLGDEHFGALENRLHMEELMKRFVDFKVHERKTPRVDSAVE